MKIVDKTNNKETTFGSLGLGAVFKRGEEYYIKTYFYDNNNAFSLSKNVISDFNSESRVIPCEVELHIIEEGVNDNN